ncbi:MAG: GTPase Era [Deltaproteobacteria bacterium]
MTKEMSRAGFIALVGRTNAGKSTLLNELLGCKLAIVTPKPQTTRHRILGVETRPGAQFIFVDTPGMHDAQNLLGERMVKVANQSLADADIVLWVIDAQAGLLAEDERTLPRLAADKRPVIVALNKIDRIKRPQILPLMKKIAEFLPGRHVIPISALRGDNLDDLMDTLEACLPESPALFPEDFQTDLPERFFAAEMVREQLLFCTHQEVPYQAAVRIDAFEEKPAKDLIVIEAQIVVARTSQRAIVLGEKGARIKEIGRRARLGLESFLGVRIYLALHVKVDAGWFTRPRSLEELGL